MCYGTQEHPGHDWVKTMIKTCSPPWMELVFKCFSIITSVFIWSLSNYSQYHWKWVHALRYIFRVKSKLNQWNVGCLFLITDIDGPLTEVKKAQCITELFNKTWGNKSALMRVMACVPTQVNYPASVQPAETFSQKHMTSVPWARGWESVISSLQKSCPKLQFTAQAARTLTVLIN